MNDRSSVTDAEARETPQRTEGGNSHEGLCNLTADDVDPLWLSNCVRHFTRSRDVCFEDYSVEVYQRLYEHYCRTAERLLALTPCPECYHPLNDVVLALEPHNSSSGCAANDGSTLVCPSCGRSVRPCPPLRLEYNLSKHLGDIPPSEARELLKVPNLWIPLRYADMFHTLRKTYPYNLILALTPGYNKSTPDLRRLLIPSRTAIGTGVLLVITLGYLVSRPQANKHDLIFVLTLLFMICLASILYRGRRQYNIHDLETRFLEDRPCMVCGYSLKGLVPTEGSVPHCPECGCSLTTLDVCLLQPECDAVNKN